MADYIPIVAIFKKDVTTMTLTLQCILFKVHQYNAEIRYKPGPELHIADWLSRHSHTKNKD